MTDREAIEILQEEHRYCLEPCYVMNAIKQAITALQEREERSKGCEYCQDNFNFWATEISGYFDKKDIKFCIHCGRPLKGADNEAD